MDTDELKANVTSGRHWLRLVYMLLFAALVYLAGVIMAALVVLQFVFALLTGRPNANLRAFGASLSRYIWQALQFLTYTRDFKPFPFSDWPEAGEDLAQAEAEAPEPEEDAAPAGDKEDDAAPAPEKKSRSRRGTSRRSTSRKSTSRKDDEPGEPS